MTAPTVADVEQAYDAGHTAGKALAPVLSNPYVPLARVSYRDALEDPSPNQLLMATMWRNGYSAGLAEAGAESDAKEGQ